MREPFLPPIKARSSISTRMTSAIPDFYISSNSMTARFSSRTAMVASSSWNGEVTEASTSPSPMPSDEYSPGSGYHG